MSAREIPQDHPAFEGHFPGEPLLPGVVLLDEALARIAADTGVAPEDWTLESGKFHDAVGPGARLDVVHRAHGEGRRFEVLDQGRLVASGVLARRAP